MKTTHVAIIAAAIILHGFATNNAGVKVFNTKMKVCKKVINNQISEERKDFACLKIVSGSR